MTPAEAYLWKIVKSKQLEGRRFQRQHSINNYIVDFYCASERLIIELDGQVHFNATAQEKDAIRDQYFESLDYTVLRYENKFLFDNLETVLEEIKGHFNRS